MHGLLRQRHYQARSLKYFKEKNANRVHNRRYASRFHPEFFPDFIPPHAFAARPIPECLIRKGDSLF